MYPVAAACLILFVKRISSIFRNVIDQETVRCAQELALINHNTQSGRRMITWSDKAVCHVTIALGHAMFEIWIKL
jgi:hypothetical protein